MRYPLYFTVIALLASTTALLHFRPDTDRVPVSVPLDQMPATIDSRIGQDVAIPPDALQLLGKGSFLQRVYTNPNRTNLQDSRDAIGLFIGYFPTQRTGQAIHSPQNCLPGAGWSFLSARHIEVANLNGNVGEYVISNGTAKQLVLYWYRSHGRSIASDYSAKAYMMLDAIRYNRTDGALVRVITPIGDQETFKDAHARATQFASQLALVLPAFVPN